MIILSLTQMNVLYLLMVLSIALDIIGESKLLMVVNGVMIGVRVVVLF